jgi:hypothetical protein
MPRELWVDDNTIPRRIRQIWVNDNGTAREIQELWTNDAGTPRLIYQALTVEVGNRTVQRTGGTPAEFHLSSDGNINVRVGSTVTTSGTWINNPAQVGLFEVRATLQSGSFSSGTFGAFQSLSATRSWTRGAGTGQFQTGTMLLEFRYTVTSEIVDTATIILTCDNS